MGLRPDLPPPPAGLTQTQCLDGTSKHNPTSDGKRVWCETCWLEFPGVEDYEHAICWKPWMIPVGTLEQKIAAREVAIGMWVSMIERARLDIYNLVIHDQNVDEAYRVTMRKRRDELYAQMVSDVETVMSLPPREPRRRRKR